MGKSAHDTLGRSNLPKGQLWSFSGGDSMGKMRDAVRTRGKIIDAAREEFAEYGLAGSRVERVAKRAKLSKQLLFHYFSSKQRLFDVVLEDTFRRREAWNLAPAAPGHVL